MLSQLFDVSAGLFQSNQPVPVLDCYKNAASVTAAVRVKMVR